ncbi:DNA mismatch repair protein MutT [Vibrio nigripulchritudo]|uniref:NUDIX hydrolase n=1 Tax=Vibrio nigripulchritudo TaxID=28173 RepID=UPI00190DA9BE|nr:NUDIX domain-containing protein [Vibrio nigripulchritudo]BCL68165.1 DNA mismatch repair protein MutT [Vibrio nigripulchritudo]BDU29493.1 DNA mismatch repair protein MutT [Vibrio nigripulchritudo]
MTKEITKLAMLDIQQQKLLCVRSKGEDLFYLPGGKPESDETHEDTLIRELREELSIHLKRDSLAYFDTYRTVAAGKSKDTFVTCHCYFADYYSKPHPSSEIEEMQWLGIQDMNRCSLLVQSTMGSLMTKGLIN